MSDVIKMLNEFNDLRDPKKVLHPLSTRHSSENFNHLDV
jgi:hypothetical protein